MKNPTLSEVHRFFSFVFLFFPFFVFFFFVHSCFVLFSQFSLFVFHHSSQMKFNYRYHIKHTYLTRLQTQRQLLQLFDKADVKSQAFHSPHQTVKASFFHQSFKEMTNPKFFSPALLHRFCSSRRLLQINFCVEHIFNTHCIGRLQVHNR